MLHIRIPTHSNFCYRLDSNGLRKLQIYLSSTQRWERYIKLVRDDCIDVVGRIANFTIWIWIVCRMANNLNIISFLSVHIRRMRCCLDNAVLFFFFQSGIQTMDALYCLIDWKWLFFVRGEDEISRTRIIICRIICKNANLFIPAVFPRKTELNFLLWNLNFLFSTWFYPNELDIS